MRQLAANPKRRLRREASLWFPLGEAAPQPDGSIGVGRMNACRGRHRADHGQLRGGLPRLGSAAEPLRLPRQPGADVSGLRGPLARTRACGIHRSVVAYQPLTPHRLRRPVPRLNGAGSSRSARRAPATTGARCHFVEKRYGARRRLAGPICPMR